MEAVPGAWRTLVTAKEAHGLTMDEARRAYPVRLRAVVTYYDPFLDPRRPTLLVHDASGGVFISLSSIPTESVKAGMLVDVTGVSAAGDFAPIVSNGSLRVVGASTLPEARAVSMNQLLTGLYDGQWVEIRGVVHSIEDLGKDVLLKLAMDDGMISATTVREASVDYLSLVGATIKVRANAVPLFNRKEQMIGVHVLFPGLAALKIEARDTTDPFTLPITPIRELLRYSPKMALGHRVHARGIMTLQWPGRTVCIQSGADGLCARVTDKTVLRPGEIVDVVGFPEGGSLSSALGDAVVRASGSGDAVVPATISAEQAFGGNYDAELVSVEGQMIGEDRASRHRTLILSAGKLLFPVVLPDASSNEVTKNWQPGSLLRVTGVCRVQVDTVEAQRTFSSPSSFRILMRAPDDVVVVRRAPWWTAEHLLRLLAVVLAATLVVLGWVIVLRYRITAQAVLIQNQNATLTDLSFQDALTGVANRRKFEETLASEFRRAAELSIPISLLMIDIDHFKLLNDTYGHQRGDECLMSVAKALGCANLRSSDLLARYGGEEFAVILPGCDQIDAIEAGERMRTAVFNLAIVLGGSTPNRGVSISIGAATMVPGKEAGSAALVTLADRALYQSKLQGRNRTTFSDVELGELTGAGTVG